MNWQGELIVLVEEHSLKEEPVLLEAALPQHTPRPMSRPDNTLMRQAIKKNPVEVES